PYTTLFRSKRSAPFQPIRIAAPRPNLLSGKIDRRGVMSDSSVCVRMIDRHVRLAASVAEPRHRAVFVIADTTLICSGGVDRPGVDIRKPVGGRKLHGIKDATVVPYLHPSIRPPVKAVPSVAPVIENGLLLEIGAARAKRELDPPLHPVGPVYVADPNRCPAVRFASDGKVNRRHRHPIVRN